MIPKKIHYCWFGGNPKSKLIKKCIKSWKKYCPDYEIIEWNESNFDLNCCDYVREAYEAKKWAFVSDYVRIWVLNTYGGIYLDTDVEIKQNMDKFLSHSAFTGFEAAEYPFTAVFGAEKEHFITNKIMESYKTRKFRISENEFDMMTNTVFVTNIFKEIYNVQLNNQTQIFDDGLAIYSNDYFCPRNYIDLSWNLTDNTHAIHWFNASWQSKEIKERHEKYKKSIEKKNRIHTIKHIPNIVLKKILGDEKYELLKAKIKRKR